MILSYVYIFLFQCLLVGIMTLAINSFGNIKKGYVTLDNLLSTSNLGYNLLYRILSPTIFIAIITIILYEIRLPFFVKNIWLISLYYFLFNLFVLIILNRFTLINKFLYFFIAISGITLSYWIYNSALRYGLNSILPDSGGFRTEWWFIIFGYFYSLLNGFTPNYSGEYKRKDDFLLKRFKILNEKYDKHLNIEFKENKLLKMIFYSIMITEDINRSFLVRKIENLLFFTKLVKTTGIMQVTSKKKLTDVGSIRLAQKIILKSYRQYDHTTKNEYELVGKIAYVYNSGGYGGEISKNFSRLSYLIR